MPHDLLDMIDADTARVKSERQRNRERMPIVAGWMDALADFQPRVIWASENGHVVGKPPE